MYEDFASVYDELMDETPYEQWCENIVGFMERYGVSKPERDAGDVLHFEEELDGNGLRELADAIAEACGSRAAVFSGSDDAGYAFCLAARQGDLRPLCREMTARLHGRGGGKPAFQQGRVQAKQEEIVDFFKMHW